jgi:hypothetical protein
MGFQSLKISAEKILSILEDFEQFCLGKKLMSPEQFMDINQDLSINTVLHVGATRTEWREDGNHLIWAAPDKSEHDLGPMDDLNVLRDYPGFHRMRSLCLGQSEVAGNELLHVPGTDRNITMIRLKDGTVAYGTDYKIALRNAVLKANLKKHFDKANPPNLWKIFYANA